jgi:hypothetical protein
LTVGPALIVMNKVLLTGLERTTAGSCGFAPDDTGNALRCLVGGDALNTPASEASLLACTGADVALSLGADCTVRSPRPFQYPLTVAGVGLLFTSVFSLSVVGAGVVEVKPENREMINWRFYVTRILPVGLCTAATMSFGNAV